MSILLWGVSILLVAAGLFGNYQFSDHSLLLRVIGMIVIFGTALAIASRTVQGKALLQFSKESRTEIRKVVWPTRQETIQTTGMVLVVVVVVGLILWGLDAILLRIIGLLGGYGGA